MGRLIDHFCISIAVSDHSYLLHADRLSASPILFPYPTNRALTFSPTLSTEPYLIPLPYQPNPNLPQLAYVKRMWPYAFDSPGAQTLSGRVGLETPLVVTEKLSKRLRSSTPFITPQSTDGSHGKREAIKDVCQILDGCLFMHIRSFHRYFAYP